MRRRGTAVVLLRESDAYAPDAFRDGLRRLGWHVGTHAHPASEDGALIVWNRSRHQEQTIRQWEAKGARVIVAENGYLGADEHGGKLFALAMNHHSGVGRFPFGDHDRWDRLGIEPAPWRHDGDKIVVLAQRCIGEPGVAMPEGWPRKIIQELASVTKRRVEVRDHPGVARTEPYDALRGAWAAVTWASGAAIKAIVAGVPVFHALPGWLGAEAARPWPWDLEDPFLGDRLPMLRRLAWAQWRRSEIASGEALKWLGL